MRVFLAGVFVLLAGVSLAAQDRGAGLGIIAGDPTGISAKLWLGETAAIDAAAAWSFLDPPAFHFHADYLLHGAVAVDMPAGSLMFHTGIGGRLKAEEETVLGVRIPFGLAYWFESQPIEVFLEIAVILDLAPATELDLGAGLGIRYFFARKDG